MATGDTGNLQNRIGAFAPKANSYRGQDKIDIMVATDVLSEGHNLQDCSAIINYDLHWNPVRLIQRSGRVDRIGSEADVIYVKNFLPVDRVEKEINIREILRRRIEEIHQYVGEDTQILESDEQLNESAMYTIYDVRDIEKLEEGEEIEFSFDEAENLIRDLEDAKPEYISIIRKLQFGLRSARNAEGINGTYAFFRQGEFPKLFIQELDGDIVDDFSYVMSQIRCAPDCKEIGLSQKDKAVYYQDIERMKSKFQQIIARSETRDRPHTAVKKSKKRLLICNDELDGDEIEENANKIDRVLNASFPRQLIGDLQKLNAMDISNREYFNNLVGFYNRHELGRFIQEQEEDRKKQPIEFICGEALV